MKVCSLCGYKLAHLHMKGDCPMCVQCKRCGHKLMHCQCHESE